MMMVDTATATTVVATGPPVEHHRTHTDAGRESALEGER